MELTGSSAHYRTDIGYRCWNDQPEKVRWDDAVGLDEQYGNKCCVPRARGGCGGWIFTPCAMGTCSGVGRGGRVRIYNREGC